MIISLQLILKFPSDSNLLTKNLPSGVNFLYLEVAQPHWAQFLTRKFTLELYKKLLFHDFCTSGSLMLRSSDIWSRFQFTVISKLIQRKLIHIHVQSLFDNWNGFEVIIIKPESFRYQMFTVRILFSRKSPEFVGLSRLYIIVQAQTKFGLVEIFSDGTAYYFTPTITRLTKLSKHFLSKQTKKLSNFELILKLMLW
jgi:hypothetical protein